MNKNLGVLLDKSTLISGCSETRCISHSLLNYLQENRLGITTKPIIRGVKKRLFHHKAYAISRLNDALCYLKVEELNPFDQKRNYFKVVNFFQYVQNSIFKDRSLENSILPPSVSSRFYSIAREIDEGKQSDPALRKQIWDNPENEDMNILAEALCLKNKYEPLFITSEDYHFIDDLVSNAIKETFGIECYTPEKTLSKLRK